MAPPIDECTRIHEDNEGAIKMAKTRLSSRWTRQVGMNYHIVRDAVEGGIICVDDMQSGEQHVDILTKALEIRTFHKHARFLLNTP